MDLASGFHVLGFWLDLGGFGMISIGFGLILHFRLLLLGFLFILASHRTFYDFLRRSTISLGRSTKSYFHDRILIESKWDFLGPPRTS